MAAFVSHLALFLFALAASSLVHASNATLNSDDPRWLDLVSSASEVNLSIDDLIQYFSGVVSHLDGQEDGHDDDGTRLALTNMDPSHPSTMWPGTSMLQPAHVPELFAFNGSLQYDPELALSSAKYSSAAYCPPSQIENWNQGYAAKSQCRDVFNKDGVELVGLYKTKVPGQDAQGFIVRDTANEMIIVSFQGTQGTFPSSADWVWDLTPTTSEQSRCMINGTRLVGEYHEGFCEYYKLIASAGLAAALKEQVLAHPNYEVLFTGHSLGGAAANVAVVDALDRLKLRPRKVLLYTYGAPRAGNYEVANFIHTHTAAAYRVVHSSDPVPHMPPCEELFENESGFKATRACSLGRSPYHHGREVWFDNDMMQANDYMLCNPWGEDPTCSDAEGGSLFDALLSGFAVHTQYYNIEIGSHCCVAGPMATEVLATVIV